VTYNLEDAIMATSSDLYRICAAGIACEFFTCSGGYAVYPSSSTYWYVSVVLRHRTG
jgi:hypothetical protein